MISFKYSLKVNVHTFNSVLFRHERLVRSPYGVPGKLESGTRSAEYRPRLLFFKHHKKNSNMKLYTKTSLIVQQENFFSVDDQKRFYNRETIWVITATFS